MLINTYVKFSYILLISITCNSLTTICFISNSLHCKLLLFSINTPKIVLNASICVFHIKLLLEFI